MVAPERVELSAGGNTLVGSLWTPPDGQRGALVVLGSSGVEDHGDRLAAAGYLTLTLASGDSGLRRAAIDLLRARQRGNPGDIGVLDFSVSASPEPTPPPAHPDATTW